MRLIILLPTNDLLKSELEDCKKKNSDVLWLQVDGSMQDLATRLLQDDCKAGYVVEGFSHNLEDVKALEAALLEQDEKAQLPLFLHWSGKPKKEDKEAIKAFRDDIKAMAEYIFEHRRLVAFEKPKKMAKAFKEARQRSKPGGIIRRGVAAAAAVALVVFLIVLLFFRDMILHASLEELGAQQLGAQCNIESLETGLGDLSLTLEQVQAANVDEPMRNLFAFQTLRTSWDVGALSSGKLHAQQLTLSGLVFDTERKESGALAGKAKPGADEGSTATGSAEAAEAASESSEFINALNNTMGSFTPPDKESLASTKAYRAYKQTAAMRSASLQKNIAALDIQAALKKSQQSLGALKQVKMQVSGTDDVQGKIDKNKADLVTLQAEISTDIASIDKDVEDLKKFKVDLKDLKKSKEMIDKAKTLKKRIDALKEKIKQAQALSENSKQQVAKAGEQIKAQGDAARKRLQEAQATVLGPLQECSNQLDAITKESQTAAKEVQEAKAKIKEAAKEDLAAAKKQYSAEGIKEGSKQLVEELIGFEVFNKIDPAIKYYRLIKKYLPVSEKSPKPEKNDAVRGRQYEFALAPEEGGIPSLYVKESLLSGIYPMDDDQIAFKATIHDFTSNMIFAKEPVRALIEGSSEQSNKTIVANLNYAADTILRGTLDMHGMNYRKEKVSGALAAVSPQHIKGDDIHIQLRDLVLGDDELSAQLAIHVKQLQLGAVSGENMHPELVAVFNKVYKDLKSITINIGLGEDRRLSTSPNLSQLLGEGLQQRVAAKLDDAKKKTEADLKAHTAAQSKDLDKIAAQLTDSDELKAKRKELEDAMNSIAASSQTEEKRIAADEASAKAGLGAFTDALAEQDAMVKQQSKELDALKGKIDKQKKRIEKDMKGGALKKFLPKF